MQDTGIVRRIDELGRVVIPKELRKTLRIREGDPLEIYTNKDELVLKKYSPITAVNEHVEAVAKGLNELFDKPCIITDNDHVIYASGAKNKDAVGKQITADREMVLKERKSVMACGSDGGKIVQVIRGEDVQSENQIIVPIISGGDCYGSVTVFDTDKTSRFTPSDVKLVKLGASFLSKQFE